MADQSGSNSLDPIEVANAVVRQLEASICQMEQEDRDDPTVKTIEATGEHALSVKSSCVLLDGGASHDVYHNTEIPEGAQQRRVDLAHGSRMGYVKGDSVTFVENDVSEEQKKSQR